MKTICVIIGFVVGAIVGMSYAQTYPEYARWFFRKGGRIVRSVGLSAKSFYGGSTSYPYENISDSGV